MLRLIFIINIVCFSSFHLFSSELSYTNMHFKNIIELCDYKKELINNEHKKENISKFISSSLSKQLSPLNTAIQRNKSFKKNINFLSKSTGAHIIYDENNFSFYYVLHHPILTKNFNKKIIILDTFHYTENNFYFANLIEKLQLNGFQVLTVSNLTVCNNYDLINDESYNELLIDLNSHNTFFYKELFNILSINKLNDFELIYLTFFKDNFLTENYSLFEKNLPFDKVYIFSDNCDFTNNKDINLILYNNNQNCQNNFQKTKKKLNFDLRPNILFKDQICNKNDNCNYNKNYTINESLNVIGEIASFDF